MNKKISDKFLNSDEYNIYLVRHGQGYHNIAERFDILFDPELTKVGIEQAFRAGVEFKLKCPNLNNFKFNVSDLQRTRLTLENFLRGYYSSDGNSKSVTNYGNKQAFYEVIVNPFIYEIHGASVDKDGYVIDKENRNTNCVQSYLNGDGYQKGDEKNPNSKMYNIPSDSCIKEYNWDKYFSRLYSFRPSNDVMIHKWYDAIDFYFI